MKILVTGFDPFGGEAVNPTYEAVQLLPDTIAEATIYKLELPTVFNKSGKILEEGIQKYRPDAVLCVGQAGGRACITIEKVAINLAEARIKDNEGNQPFDMPLHSDGDTAYFSNLPIKAMVNHIRAHKIPAHISYTAGTFVCNAVMYHLLYLIQKKYPDIKGGFIHVPYAAKQTVDKPAGTPSLPLPTIANALEYAIEAIPKNKVDYIGPMGTIM